MDCAGDLGRSGYIQQGSGCFLVCDGHDRGSLWIPYSGSTSGLLLFTLTKVVTGAVPFSDKPPRAAMLAIVGGDRPPRPTHPALTDGLWALTKRCWNKEPRLRPPVLRISCSLYVSTLKPRILC